MSWWRLALCRLGRHRWRPVFRHVAVNGDVVRSLFRCTRSHPGGALCLQERYFDVVTRRR